MQGAAYPQLRIQCFVQGHFNMPTVGAGIWTANPSIEKSPPTLPSEPQLPHWDKMNNKSRLTEDSPYRYWRCGLRGIKAKSCSNGTLLAKLNRDETCHRLRSGFFIFQLLYSHTYIQDICDFLLLVACRVHTTPIRLFILAWLRLTYHMTWSFGVTTCLNAKKIPIDASIVRRCYFQDWWEGTWHLGLFCCWVFFFCTT